MLMVSGVARSTTPVRSVPSASNQEPDQVVEVQYPHGPLRDLGAQQRGHRAAHHPVELAADRRCDPDDQARAPNSVDTSASAGRYSSGWPAAWDTKSSRAPARAAAWVTCATPLMPSPPGAVLSTGAR